MVMKVDKQAKGFRTIWIRYDAETLDKHQLFFKEHSIRKQEPEYPKGKTLFVLNIPPYATTENLKNVIGELCGLVRSVVLINSKGFKTGYIVFEKESALEKALELPKDTIVTLNTKESVCPIGLKKWCQEYNNSIYDESILKQEIEEYMESYDKQVADNIAKEKAAEEGADGWVTITGRKKRGQFAPSRKESTIDKVQHKQEERKGKKQLLNFYTFQIRESKKQNLAELRKKFELDKKRLHELKQKRTFKPF